MKAKRWTLGVVLVAAVSLWGLVEADAYLLYARAAGRWVLLSNRQAGGDAPGADAEARRIVAECAAAGKLAGKAGRTDLAARSALLAAQVLSAWPLRDGQAALKALRDSWAVLSAEPTTATAAAWLRAEVLLELGLTNEALKAISDLPEAGSTGPAGLLLRLAEALADRYVDGDTAARQDTCDMPGHGLHARGICPDREVAGGSS